jgi:hypothetical protein
MKTPKTTTKNAIVSGEMTSTLPRFDMDTLDRLGHVEEALLAKASFEHAPFSEADVKKGLENAHSIRDLYSVEANEAVKLDGDASAALAAWHACVGKGRTIRDAGERYLVAIGVDPAPFQIGFGGMSQVSIARNLVRLPGAFDVCADKLGASPYVKGLHQQALAVAGEANDRLAAWKKAQAAADDHAKMMSKVHGAYELAVFKVRDMLRSVFTNDAASLASLKLPARWKGPRKSKQPPETAPVSTSIVLVPPAS